MDERRSISPHVILDFGNQGILGLQAPREYGGLALGYGDTLKVIEQLGAIDQTLTMMTIVHNSLGIWPIVQYAEPTLKADLVPRLAAGRELVAFAITEPGAGSNPQALAATATPDGQGAWLLRGQKSWSGTAGWASVINVFAQNVDSTGEGRGVNGFVVPRGAKGLRIGPEALTLGMRGMVQNTIYLEDVRVRSSDRLGEIGDGMKVAHAAMMQGRLAIGAACVGGMKRCLQLLVRYAAKRNVSTGLLVDNPVLLDRAAAVSSALAGIESLVSCAAEQFDTVGDVPSDVFVVCKIAGSEWFCRAADDLVQFLGGRGYIETNIAAQLLRDARVTRILEGPTEALTMFLGSRVIHDGGALHGFIRDHLRAPAVSARLADAALDIHDRCTSGSHSDGVDARRWAYALIGRIATEAVLFAATTQRSDASAVGRAEHRFEVAIASARQEAALGPRLSSEGLMSLVDGYSAAIGDVEQSLSGEDHDLDAMLRRDAVRPLRAQAAPSKISRTDVTTVEHDVKVSTVPAVVTTASPVHATAGASANRAPATEGDIERFVVKRIAAALKMREASVDASRTFFDYGLDSVTTVMLVASLEEWLGIVCNPEIVYEIPNIRRFAAHIAQRQHSR
jgi:alkylation response protein AidB-like acyl-CoA dehydrogenase/acyl carrier protein